MCLGRSDVRECNWHRSALKSLQRKQIPWGLGVWDTPHLGLLGGESVAQPRDGSAGSWAALAWPQIRVGKSLYLGRLFL